MKKIIFRFDCGTTPEIGTGHFVRSRRIAQKLVRDNVEIEFLVTENDYSKNIAKDLEFKVNLFDGTENQALEIIKEKSPDILVIDRLDTDEKFMKEAKKLTKKLVSFDDYGSGAKHADIVINGIFGEDGEYSGPNFVLTPENITQEKTIEKKVRRIIASFGGYDHLNITTKVTRALEKIDEDIEIILIVGSASKNLEELEEINKNSKRFTILRTPKNYVELLKSSDIALVSGGLSVFDSMAAGIPTIVISQYNHQSYTGKRFHKLNSCIFLGRGDGVSEELIKNQVEELIKNYDKRLELSKNAQEQVDGKGLLRIVETIEKLL